MSILDTLPEVSYMYFTKHYLQVVKCTQEPVIFFLTVEESGKQCLERFICLFPIRNKARD